MGLLGAGCATTTPASSFMPLGQAASAPEAFIDFCKRQPIQCGVDADSAPAAIAVAQTQSNSQIWRAAFASTEGKPLAARANWDRPTAAIEPAVRAAPASVDWARLFAEAKAEEKSADDLAAAKPEAVVRAPVEGAAFNPKLWAMLKKVNTRVNRAIDNRSDLSAYGVEDFWNTPLSQGQKLGDCEDFVLEKRAALIAAGIAPHALSIAVVETSARQAHAVLVVTTTQGDYVLDNLTPWVLAWDKTAYRWQARQVSGSDAFSWARVQAPGRGL